jgi:8-oxo-dGTP pyrophosphatase MutT (NUDIX family)
MAMSDRPRAAAAVVRTEGTEILLVKHRWHDGTTSWILPGGALLPGEKPEEAVLRELDEETGLKGTAVRFLFTMPYDLGTSATFLVEVDATAQVSLGYDPEEAQESSKMLQDVAWFPIKDVRDNPEVRQVLASLDGLVPEQGEEKESSQPCV